MAKKKTPAKKAAPKKKTVAKKAAAKKAPAKKAAKKAPAKKAAAKKVAKKAVKKAAPAKKAAAKKAAPAKKATAKKAAPAKKAAAKKAAPKKLTLEEKLAAEEAEKKAKAAKRPVKNRIDTPEIQEKIRELIKLAKEQEYLTYDDIHEILPNNIVEPADVDAILDRLRQMEFDIIDASEVDRFKDKKKGDLDSEEETKDQKLDILDDPVRMYLKQMGQVPLLTREQEVEISKRIEDAEIEVQKFLHLFGFTASGYLTLADKLMRGKERFDRVILDKKIEGDDPDCQKAFGQGTPRQEKARGNFWEKPSVHRPSLHPLLL